MWTKRTIVAAGAVMLGCIGILPARGQADATARRSLETSVFGGPAGVFTGLDGGHNLSFTAGVDIGFRPFFGLVPAVEARGMYPQAAGTVDKQKNVLGGLRVEKRRANLRLYGDVLFGRGQIEYLNGGLLNLAGNYRYVVTTSNVLSPGAGVTYDLNSHFSLFADAQLQRYNTPVTASGSLWSTPITVGVTYRFPFLKHGHPY